MAKRLKIAGATVNQTPIDWQGNTAHILDALREAQARHVDLLCFPELCITGYGCEDLFLAEWVCESAWQELLTIAAHVHAMTVCVGLPIRFQDRVYNGVAVLRDKALMGIALKQHLPANGVHYEPRWFSAWPSGRRDRLRKGGIEAPVGDLTFRCRDVVFGFEICEDAWVENRPIQSLCQRGATLIINPSASHYAFGKSRRVDDMVCYATRQYKCTYLYVNLLGNEAGSMIYGGDVLIAHRGKLLARHRRFSFLPFAIGYAEVDTLSDVVPQDTLPCETPDKNEDFAGAIALALFDYLRKSGAKGFVISLSGGADSSCCAVAVAEMWRRAVGSLGQAAASRRLGLPSTASGGLSQLLTCVYQHTENSSEDTFAAAKALSQSLDCTLYDWSVGDVVQLYIDKVQRALSRRLTWLQDDIALQNIQARARVPAAWLLANTGNRLFIATANRSEGDVGYATVDGDLSGSLAPLAGVDKPFILQWLGWARETLSYEGLSAVLGLEPTAELRPSRYAQTDEKDLMPYPLLCAIERLAVGERRSPQEVYARLAPRYEKDALQRAIALFFSRWAQSQWKRERLPPSFHFDDFNISPRSGCRFPVLSGRFVKEMDKLG